MTVAPPEEISPRAEPTHAPRLPFLDGVRGFAAALVVVNHLPAFFPTPDWVARVGMGNPWVAIFITLSGLCLYLPSAGRDGVEMPRPFWDFMRRRARRIVPAWYASLALCVAVGAFFHAVHYHQRFPFLPRNGADVLTHLALLHSATAYSGSINGPGYTLGTEWQLYILMIVLLGVARRFGWAALLLGLAVLAAPFPGVAGKLIGKVVSPTFTVPFILGLLAARAIRRPPRLWERLGRFAPGVLTALVAASMALYVVINPHSHNVACWMAALATALGCVLMAARPLSLGARLFGSRVGRTLGDFSYSLYLTHFPLLALASYFALAWAVPSDRQFLVIVLPCLPIIFGFAFLFHLVFERPFLNSRAGRQVLALEGGRP